MIPSDIQYVVQLMPHAPAVPKWWRPRVQVEMPNALRKGAVRNAIAIVEQRRGAKIRGKDVIEALENARAPLRIGGRPSGPDTLALADVVALVTEDAEAYAEQQMLAREAKWRAHWAGVMLAALQDTIATEAPKSVVLPVLDASVDALAPASTARKARAKTTL